VFFANVRFGSVAIILAQSAWQTTFGQKQT
jgi:hypothetical protein